MATSTFVADTGVQVHAVTAAQMREVDRVAIGRNSPTLQQMMENAGRALAATIIDMLGRRWRQRPVVVLAGTGGNGGGGICAARHLANHGGAVTVTTADPRMLSAPAAQQLEVFRDAGGRLVSVGDLPTLAPALVTDAVIGYSLAGAPRDEALAMIKWANTQSVPVVALDVPSGVDATSGEAPGAAVSADVTVTLALPKTGLDTAAAGSVWLADIGIPAEVLRLAGVEIDTPIFDGRFRIALTPT
jgi:NAD(P)H-hydrate epimerase